MQLVTFNEKVGPSRVGNLHEVVCVYEYHGVPHGLQLQRLEYVPIDLCKGRSGHVLGGYLLQRPHGWKQVGQRDEGAQGEQLRDGQAPAPGRGVVQQSAQDGSDDTAICAAGEIWRDGNIVHT